MNPARQAVGEATLEIRVESRSNSAIARGDIPADRTNPRVAEAGIRELRRIRRDINAHNFTPVMIRCGCDINLGRCYKSAERPLAPNPIPFSPVFVFVRFHSWCSTQPANARHHPRPCTTCMRGSVMGRRVHAVVRLRPPSPRRAASPGPYGKFSLASRSAAAAPNACTTNRIAATRPARPLSFAYPRANP